MLNGDDPNAGDASVHPRPGFSMFGLSDGAEVRGEKISAVWPDRFRRRSGHGTERAGDDASGGRAAFCAPGVGGVGHRGRSGGSVGRCGPSRVGDRRTGWTDGTASTRCGASPSFAMIGRRPLSIPRALQFLGSMRARRKIHPGNDLGLSGDSRRSIAPSCAGGSRRTTSSVGRMAYRCPSGPGIHRIPIGSPPRYPPRPSPVSGGVSAG